MRALSAPRGNGVHDHYARRDRHRRRSTRQSSASCRIGRAASAPTGRQAGWRDLPGEFAGIVRFDVPTENAEGLAKALSGLESSGLRIAIARGDATAELSKHRTVVARARRGRTAWDRARPVASPRRARRQHRRAPHGTRQRPDVCRASVPRYGGPSPFPTICLTTSCAKRARSARQRDDGRRRDRASRRPTRWFSEFDGFAGKARVSSAPAVPPARPAHSRTAFSNT